MPCAFDPETSMDPLFVSVVLPGPLPPFASKPYDRAPVVVIVPLLTSASPEVSAAMP